MALLLVLAAVVRPWSFGAAPPLIAVILSVPVAPARPPASSALPSTGPADPTRLKTVIQMLAGFSGTWGVGAGAVPATAGTPGTPTVDWSDWVAVEPDSIGGQASPPPGEIVGGNELAGVPVKQDCLGLPGLPSGAQILAITAPSGPLANYQIQGWREAGWHDEPRDLEPVPGIRQMTPFLAGDISYLQPLDGRAWLDGRYIFRIAGPTPMTLTVCLGQS